MTAWGTDHATIEMDSMAEIKNGADMVHGGVIAALIDTAGAHAGVFNATPGQKRNALTILLNINLVRNVKEGVLITKAKVRKAGKTIFMSSCDVEDGNGNL